MNQEVYKDINDSLEKSFSTDKLTETKQEDDYCFNGCFWVIADTFRDILLNNNVTLFSYKYLVDYDGKPTDINCVNKTHREVWNNMNGFDDQYYPRGRVSTYRGEAFINIPSQINLPHIINAIIKDYDLSRIDSRKFHIVLEDIKHKEQNHYKFDLK